MIVCPVCSTAPTRDESWTPYSSRSPGPPFLCRCRRLILDAGDGMKLLSFRETFRTLASNPDGRVCLYDDMWFLVDSTESGFLDAAVEDVIRCCVAEEVLGS